MKIVTFAINLHTHILASIAINRLMQIRLQNSLFVECGRLAESKFWSPCVLRFADGLSISLVRTDFTPAAIFN